MEKDICQYTYRVVTPPAPIAYLHMYIWTIQRQGRTLEYTNIYERNPKVTRFSKYVFVIQSDLYPSMRSQCRGPCDLGKDADGGHVVKQKYHS